MKQYASRKKEFLKEMEIFLSRSMGRENKNLKEYPLNNFYSRRASLLDGVTVDIEPESKTPEVKTPRFKIKKSKILLKQLWLILQLFLP